MGPYTGIDLDVRLQGSELHVAAANATSDFTLDFTFKGLVNGVEFYAFDSTPGDKINFVFQYYYEDEWTFYKKFAKDFNIYPNVLQKYILVPAEPQIGMRICMQYENVHATNAAKFSYNLYQFKDSETVDVLTGQSGENW